MYTTHTAREAFHKLLWHPSSDPRYLEHLKERPASAFEANEDSFEEVVSEVGGELLSDKFLLFLECMFYGLNVFSTEYIQVSITRPLASKCILFIGLIST